MYAVMKHLGKQYVVKQGDIIDLNRIEKAEKDSELQISDVLLINDGSNTIIGSPIVENAFVKVKVLGEIKGKKIVIFKHKKRKNYRRKQGFRPIFTSVKIEDIVYQNN